MSAESKLAARLHDAFFASEGLRIGKAVWLALADAVRAAGWVSPEEATARETAARREALLERDQYASKSMDATMGMWQEQHARAERSESTLAGLRRVQAETVERYQKAEAKVARVEALAHRARLGTVSASDITAALAEPERDEEGGRDGH